MSSGRIEVLLKSISRRHENLKEAQDALTELKDKYGSKVREICIKLCGRYKRRMADTEDLEQELWIKVFLRAETYKSPESESSDESKFFSWLKTIATNIIFQENRTKGGTEAIYFLSLEEKNEFAQSVEDGKEEPTFQSILQEEISKYIVNLEVRDQEIIRTTLDHYPKKVPTSDIKRLSLAFGVSSDNVRQIRKKHVDRITEMILDIRSRMS